MHTNPDEDISFFIDKIKLQSGVSVLSVLL